MLLDIDTSLLMIAIGLLCMGVYRIFRQRQYHQGLKRFTEGEYDKAINAYDRALRFNPRDSRAFYNRAIMKAHKGDYPGAVSDYGEAIKRDPRLQQAYINRGQAHIALDALDAAQMDFRQAMKLNPDNPLVYLQHGYLEYIQGSTHSALADFDNAIALLQTSLDKITRFGPYLGGKQNLAAEYNQLARAYLLRAAVSQTQEEDLQKVLMTADQALAEAPNNAHNLLIQAAAQHHLNNYEAALALNERALNIQADPLIYNNRGEVFFTLGAYTQALEDFEHCLAVMPNFYEAVAGKAITTHALGQRAEAHQLWQVLVERHPDHNDLAWIQRRLYWHPTLVAEASKLVTGLEEDA